MHKIAVVGDMDSVLFFMAFGMDVYPVEASEQDENRKIIDALARDGYGIIFITEQIASTISETIDRYNNEMTPGIILIPSNAGSMGLGLERVRDNVERAVGINILD
ncbi:MAG: V-type ATP synthase subunit F [Oscillospiraceae bacterium]|jgi:V/A-type H+-transporting ATPase subunit F|nr:V-type ATP synthase subunit F [Oscillospiraceae bacterium]